MTLRVPSFSGGYRALFEAVARSFATASLGVAAACDNASAPTPSPSQSPAPAASQPDAHVEPTGFDAGESQPSAALDSGLAKDAGVMVQVDAAASLPGPWVPFECNVDGSYAIPRSTFQAGLDYLGMYRSNPIGADEPTSLQLVLHGTACTGALDQTVCASALKQALAVRTCDKAPCLPFFMATAGDTVARVSSAAELMRWIGSVDRESDAVLAAVLGEAEIGCWMEFDASTQLHGSRIRVIEGGYEIETNFSCYGEASTAITHVDANANVQRLQKLAFCLGRRPDTLLAPRANAAANELGGYFSTAAWLEAASVFAFERLTRELTRLAAPHTLIQAALRSTLEEISHARMMQAFALQFGGARTAPELSRGHTRSMLAIALENATEGCVRESYGALLACHQALAARDASLRAVMQQIAQDELRHAQLAWQIAAWLEPQLPQAERERVQLARRAAYAQLSRELTSTLSPPARQLLGLPDPSVAASLLAQLAAALQLSA